MTASEKVAYLKGLAEGLGIKDSTNEGKLTLAIIDVLESMADDLEAVEAHAADLSASINDISEDMEYLEDMCIGDLDEDDDDDYDDDDEGCSGCSGCCGGDDEQEYEVTCPKCGETITVYEEDIEFGSIRCPKCDSELEFETDDESDE